MFVKITSIAALDDYVLLVGFANGQFRMFDLKPMIKKYPPFKALEDHALYKGIRIDLGGYGVSWNDDLDLSSDGLYEQGTPVAIHVDIEFNKTKLIEEVVAARKNAGLSQKQLEILSGVAQPCIARTETGASDPQLSTILKMLKPLGLTLSLSNL